MVQKNFRMSKMATKKVKPTKKIAPASVNVIGNPSSPCVWKKSEMSCIRHFLLYGNEKGSYLAEETTPSKECAPTLSQCIENGCGSDVVEEILKISQSGRVIKDQPLVYALAVCAKLAPDIGTKQAAFKALSDVCQSPLDLFNFIDYTEKISGGSSGWGRAQRKAISDWYNNKDLSCLATAVTQYRQRSGWSHVDVIRLAHIKPKNDVVAGVLQYVVRGWTKTKPVLLEKDGTCPEVQKLVEFLDVVETVKHSTDPQQVALLAAEHKLHRDVLPTWMLNSKEVWRAVLPHMPLEQILPNLGKMTSLGLLDANTPDSCFQLVIEKLMNEELIKEEKIHPFTLLAALDSYKKGEGDKGKKAKWIPNTSIVSNLDGAFYAAFKNVEATKKRYLLAVDVSGSMQYGGVTGTPQTTPAMATAALAMTVARVEKDYQMLAFAKTGLDPISLTAQMSLQEICHGMSEVQMGGTECSLPVTWAQESNKKVDVFMILTDCETWTGTIHPADALRKYRKAMKIPQARLIMCALTSSGFSLADSDDAGMLDIAGFDAGTANIISQFVLGQV